MSKRLQLLRKLICYELEKYPNVVVRAMGFATDWKEEVLWSK